jgi:hypothetical protein
MLKSSPLGVELPQFSAGGSQPLCHVSRYALVNELLLPALLLGVVIPRAILCIRTAAMRSGC